MNGRVRRYIRIMLPGAIVAFFLLVAAFPQLFVRHSCTEMNILRRLEGPSGDFWFGTDQFGRDVYSRVMLGTRVSYGVSLGAVAFAVAIGTAAGVAGGLFKTAGFVVMRIVELMLCFPPIIAAIFALALLKPGMAPLVIVIGFLYGPRIARVVQSAVLGVAKAPFIEAERAMGASLSHIISKGILPQIVAPVIVQGTIMLATAMLMEAGLSFLGLGIPPPTPTWGNLISEARRVIGLSILPLLFPSLILSLNIIALNLLGDAVRDYMDPKLRGVI